MIPELVHIGVLHIPTLGVFFVLALFWGSYYLWKNILLTPFKEVDVFDSVGCGIVTGIMTGRLLYVVLHSQDFGWDFGKILLLNGYPGVHLIGFIAGFLGGVYLCARSKRIMVLKFFDYLMASLFVSIAIGKLGSFISGAEIGTRTRFPIAITYKNLDGMRHPTALYEAILFFIGCVVLHRIVMMIRRDESPVGTAFLTGIFMCSAILFAADWIRAFRVFTYGISIDGVISLLILLTSGVSLVYYFRTFIFRTLLHSKRG